MDYKVKVVNQPNYEKVLAIGNEYKNNGNEDSLLEGTLCENCGSLYPLKNAISFRCKVCMKYNCYNKNGCNIL